MTRQRDFWYYDHIVCLSFGDYFILIVALGFMSPVSWCNPHGMEPLIEKCYFCSDTKRFGTIAAGIQKTHTSYINIIFITFKLESGVQLRPKEYSDQSFATKTDRVRCKVGTVARLVHNYRPQRSIQSQGPLAVSGPLVRHPAGKWFATDPEVKKALTSYYTELTHISSTLEYKALVRWWDKCLNANSDYGEVWCVPSAMRVPWSVMWTVRYACAMKCDVFRPLCVCHVVWCVPSAMRVPWSVMCKVRYACAMKCDV
jgi:hypothetical protein